MHQVAHGVVDRVLHKRSRVNPQPGGGTHRRRATFERCEVFMGGVREGLGCCSCHVCVSVSGVVFSVGVCVCVCVCVTC